jgi:5'-nucleotidase
MAYPIDRKLVIGVASSALFDLAESDAVFRNEGEDKYRKYQRHHQKSVLGKGVAFPFIRRFLSLNLAFPDQMPVEVVLLSHNDPDTGLRVLHSIKEHGLDITRAGFLSGKSPFEYIPAFNCALFLSANPVDVKNAIDAGHPAGTVLRTSIEDDAADTELRIAFDFDGVIADDQAEAVYQKHKDISEFQRSESEKVDVPHDPGPLQNLFKKLSFFQKLELKRKKDDDSYKRILRIAIVTARSAPAHERVVTTLREWGVSADETFFLGGIDKTRILKIMKPHIYFDDQMAHLGAAAEVLPSVHIPFGIVNRHVEKNPNPWFSSTGQ